MAHVIVPCQAPLLILMLKTIQAHLQHAAQQALIAEGALLKTVPTAQIVAAIAKNSVVQLNGVHVTRIVKWVAGLGVTDFVTEYLSWYSANVNPMDVTIEATYMEELIKLLNPKEHPIIVLNMTELQHDESTVKPQTRPMPDVGCLMSNGDINGLAKNPALMTLIETAMRDNRAKCLPMLSERANDAAAMSYLRPLEHAITLAATNKTVCAEMAQGGAAGKPTPEKLAIMFDNWARITNDKDECMRGLAKDLNVGPSPSSAVVSGAATAEDVVNAHSFTGCKFVGSAGDVPDHVKGSGLHVGAVVVTLFRRTHQFGDNYKDRQDIKAGTETTIEGFDNSFEPPRAIVSFTKETDDGPYTVQTSIQTELIALKEDTTGASIAAPAGKATPLKGYPYLKPESEHEEVCVIDDWEAKTAEKHIETNLHYIKSALGFVMHNVAVQSQPFFWNAVV